MREISVKLIDYMGNDKRICQAARLSYDNYDSEYSEERDAKLINYLMKNKHTSPFEMGELQFMIECPISTARQLMRYRTANYNEKSGRYTEFNINDFYINNDNDEYIIDKMQQIIINSNNDYQNLLKIGCSKEIARDVLTLGIMTKIVVKNDLHNWINFIEQRTKLNAQSEIRYIAEEIEKYISNLYPLTYSAYLKYRKNAMVLDAYEVDAIKEVLSSEYKFNNELMIDEFMNNYKNKSISGKDEFKRKLEFLFNNDGE